MRAKVFFSMIAVAALAPRVRYEMLGSCQLFANWLQFECMEYTSDRAEPAALTTSERASGSGCDEPVYGLGNGQWFGYVDSAFATEIQFDLACWFDGARRSE